MLKTINIYKGTIMQHLYFYIRFFLIFGLIAFITYILIGCGAGSNSPEYKAPSTPPQICRSDANSVECQQWGFIPTESNL